MARRPVFYFLFFLLASIPLLVPASIPQSEHDALVALYSSTGGDSWTHHDHWGEPVGTEGTWYGVTLDPTETTVVELRLQSNHLEGAVPSELGNLTGLERLYIHNNGLTGDLPTQLGNLTHLRSFVAGGNDFDAGPLWSWIQNCTGLTELGLHSCNRNGTLPAWLGTLSKLQSIQMNGNPFTGPIPLEVTQLPDLTTFYMDGCQLSGSIPREFGSMPSLSRIYLSWNQLTGTIPAELGNLSGLSFLGLSHNQLTGPIPASLDRCAGLTDLYLDENPLEMGPIPEWLRGHTNLGALGLDQTGRTGEIPTWLPELTGLYYIQLGTNALHGTIPPGLGGLSGLMLLRLGRNRLWGPVPAELGNLTRLWGLDLSANAFTGELPGDLANLTGLSGGSGLDLRWNALHTADPALKAFLDTKQAGGDWLGTQTLAPADFAVSGITSTSAHFSWTPMAYQEGPGGYDIPATTDGGTPLLLGTANDKAAVSLDVADLVPSTVYRATAQSFSAAWTHNGNVVESEPGTELVFTTPGPPRVTGLEPSTGPVWGGVSVVVSGVNLAGAMAVRFGEVDAASLTVDSPTRITAVSPAHNAGDVFVAVTTPDGTSAPGAESIFTYVFCGVSCSASAPAGARAGEAVPFTAQAEAPYCQGQLQFHWEFGDGASSFEQSPAHTYAAAGTYDWTFIASANDFHCVRTGSVAIAPALPGDCDGDAQVSIGEVQKAINMFLGTLEPGCGADYSGDGTVSIGEVQKVINAFLGLPAAC